MPTPAQRIEWARSNIPAIMAYLDDTHGWLREWMNSQCDLALAAAKDLKGGAAQSCYAYARLEERKVYIGDLMAAAIGAYACPGRSLKLFQTAGLGPDRVNEMHTLIKGLPDSWDVSPEEWRLSKV